MQIHKEQMSQEAILYQQLPNSASILPIAHHNSQNKCRICSGPNQPNKKLSSFCSCTIDKGAFHQPCLKQFLQSKINKRIQKQLSYTEEIQCQLCNQNFYVKIQTNYKCNQSQNLTKIIYRNSFVIGILFIGFVLSLIVLISCSYKLNHQSKNQSTNTDMNINQTLIAFIVLSASLLLLFSWKIIVKLLIVPKVTINF